MPQEVLLTTSSSPESSILIHDLHNSNLLQSFRQSITAQNGLAPTISKKQFLAAQLDRGLVNVYSWCRDTVSSKMILPEKIRSLKMSPSGSWCVGGSESGGLFLWEVRIHVCRSLH
jgi:pre-rRNA-processing protein IPI3